MQRTRETIREEANQGREIRPIRVIRTQGSDAVRPIPAWLVESAKLMRDLAEDSRAL
jgi:hypothetical protein